MGPLTVAAESFLSLGRNKVRTVLSVLGIVIGVAAVIAMVAVGAGAQRAVEREIAAMGDDWVAVVFIPPNRGGVRQREERIRPYVVRNDAQAVLEQCSAVRAVSVTNRTWGGLRLVSAYGNHQTNGRGVEPSYFDIRRWPVIRGEPMTTEDLQTQARKCWIGITVAEELFGSIDPIGQEIRVNLLSFRVAGILEPRGVSSEGEDYDDMALMPLTAFQAIVGPRRTPRSFFAAAQSSDQLELAKAQIRQTLRERHRLDDEEEDNFRLFDRSETAATKESTTQIFNVLLTSIASISLLVGGVGIMNIMLVSVTERTREIGLRMAIGANTFHVLGQFLCEAVVLCAGGGVLGFFGGWALAELVAGQLSQMQAVPVEYEISYWMAGIAIGVASAVGLFFGFYPAWRACRLDPIDALRYE